VGTITATRKNVPPLMSVRQYYTVLPSAMSGLVSRWCRFAVPRQYAKMGTDSKPPRELFEPRVVRPRRWG